MSPRNFGSHVTVRPPTRPHHSETNVKCCTFLLGWEPVTWYCTFLLWSILTAVKTSYPLANITWPYRSAQLTRWHVFWVNGWQVSNVQLIASWTPIGFRYCNVFFIKWSFVFSLGWIYVLQERLVLKKHLKRLLRLACHSEVTCPYWYFILIIQNESLVVSFDSMIPCFIHIHLHQWNQRTLEMCLVPVSKLGLKLISHWDLGYCHVLTSIGSSVVNKFCTQCRLTVTH